MEFSSSVQDISWFRNRYREGTLRIKPPFQRKPVWVERQKCYLIESILMGLPIPEIYIQQVTSPEGETTYAIVDGQQRIRTVLQFIGSETDPQEQVYNKFVLDKLPAESSWRNLAFADLSDEVKRRFYGYRFTVRYLDTDDEDEIRDMFRRLNKFLTPLKPQELRNATYSGPFATLVNKLADDEYWAENRLVSPAIIRRMGDVEYVSELLIGTMHGPQGGSPAIIDAYYAQYEDYEDEFPGQSTAKRLFDDTLGMIKRLFPNIKEETRWSNKTDFYTLFVALADLLRTHRLSDTALSAVRQALRDFAEEVDQRLRDDQAPVSSQAADYVRAVVKGANDKRRRADRHAALIAIVEPYFASRYEGDTEA